MNKKATFVGFLQVGRSHIQPRMSDHPWRPVEALAGERSARKRAARIRGHSHCGWSWSSGRGSLMRCLDPSIWSFRRGEDAGRVYWRSNMHVMKEGWWERMGSDLVGEWGLLVWLFVCLFAWWSVCFIPVLAGGLNEERLKRKDSCLWKDLGLGRLGPRLSVVTLALLQH